MSCVEWEIICVEGKGKDTPPHTHTEFREPSVPLTWDFFQIIQLFSRVKVSNSVPWAAAGTPCVHRALLWVLAPERGSWRSFKELYKISAFPLERHSPRSWQVIMKLPWGLIGEVVPSILLADVCIFPMPFQQWFPVHRTIWSMILCLSYLFLIQYFPIPLETLCLIDFRSLSFFSWPIPLLS